MPTILETGLVNYCDCDCDLRADRLAKHCLRVHGKDLHGSEIAAAMTHMSRDSNQKQARPRKCERFTEIKRAKKQCAAYTAKLATQPRKCTGAECKNKVQPPEQFCASCKQARVDHAQSLRAEPRGVLIQRCLTCGSPTVADEDYCYTCLGD